MSFHRTLCAWGVPEALRRYPGLSITVASADAALCLAGTLAFSAAAPGLETITDSYEVAVTVPQGFPRRTPRARDLAGRIPKDYHHLDDGSFCLGSPARLRLALAEAP